MDRILVVAPTADLRRSLRFALESEGYFVTDSPWMERLRVSPGEFDCTIVDSHAAVGDLEDLAEFCRSFHPVILLANAASHPLAAFVFSIVFKPLLGPFLSQAVRRAIDATAPKYDP